VLFQIEVAELKIRQNRREDGLADLEKILGDLNPDSWLHHDVRRRMEEVFLRTGDQDGLVKYYEKWTERHPEDVDAMARMAKFLAASARVPEATGWMEKALKLAPKRLELRRAFVEQLVDEQRFTEAISQYELLAKSDPGNTDLLRDWGKLVLRDKTQDAEKRKAAATRIWREMVTSHPKDAVTISQVADLFRQANINDEAIALYQKAIELAPEEPQYREYLGEFYHVLKRPEDALATWRAIAEGPRRTAVNVARLAEVYNSFGYLDQAIVEIATACQLDPKDFSLELTAADYHGRADKYDEALAFVAAAEKLAANDDERESVIKARVEVLQSSRRLDDEIERMAAKVGADQTASAQDWHILARYYEADRRWSEATETIGRALDKDDKSIPALATSARIAELSGDFARAAEMSRQLANADRRQRSDHLQNVARLESQLGRTEEALKAG
jgi:tetratricopeptide (TPR) repeat protein